MKLGLQIVSLLLCLILLIGCAPVGENIPATTAPVTTGAALETMASEPQEAIKTEQALLEIAELGESPDDNYRTFYEIFVYSFCDSNGDGIGDIQGVISKLDYLEDLGINGIWFMPVHPSQSYHKYDVRDYYDIDPQYGTLSDMEQLLADCEQRGIRVITDLVLNHTGDDHAWFLTAVQYLKTLPSGAEPNVAECPYVDYYSFSREGGSNWHKIAGSDWYYLGQFSPDMPDLNLGNEVVREEIKKIMEFWIGKGVDGFRLDAAKEFYSGDPEKNIEVLNWIQKTAVAIDPDCYLVAEVWENFANVTHYYSSEITSIFDFPFADASGKIVSVLRGAGDAKVVSSYAKALERANTAYSESNPHYIDAPFLSNHDIGRIAGFVGRDPLKMKLAGAMNIFMSGSCFIYYGEEIGMVGAGNDPSKRAPMYWNEARDLGTTNPPPECVLPEEYPMKSLEGQLLDDSSLFNYYRRAIAIRKAIPVISHGDTFVEETLNTGCISAQRKVWNDHECIILMNIQTEAAQVDLSGYENFVLAASLSADENEISLTNTTLHMPAYGVAILVPQVS